MEKPPFEAWPSPDESPALPGPDYVALVIEWDAIPDDVEEEVTDRMIISARRPVRKVLAAIAALGAVLALGWGFRRLHHD